MSLTNGDVQAQKPPGQAERAPNSFVRFYHSGKRLTPQGLDRKDPGSLYRYLVGEFHRLALERHLAQEEGVLDECNRFHHDANRIRREGEGSLQASRETVGHYLGMSTQAQREYAALHLMHFLLLDLAVETANAAHKEKATGETREFPPGEVRMGPKIHIGINGMATETLSIPTIDHLRKLHQLFTEHREDDHFQERLHAELEGLWHAVVDRPELPTNRADEDYTGDLLLGYAQTLYRTLPELDRVRQRVQQEQGIRINQGEWLEPFTWHTGDSDGQQVAAERSRAFRDKLQRRILDLYREDLEEIRADSFCTGNDKATIDRVIRYLTSHRDQPDHFSNAHFLEELKELSGSEKVDALKLKARTFGENFLKIEFRENKNTLHSIIGNLLDESMIRKYLPTLDGKSSLNYAMLPPHERGKLLTRLVTQVRREDFEALQGKLETIMRGESPRFEDKETRRVFDRLAYIRQVNNPHAHIDPKRNIYLFTVAETEDVNDFLAAKFLLKMARDPVGLGISLQFESNEHYAELGKRVSELLDNECVLSHIQLRSNNLVFAIGLSDTTKRGGLCGMLNILGAAQHFWTACAEHNVNARYNMLTGHETGRGAGNIFNLMQILNIDSRNVKFSAAGTRENRAVMLNPDTLRFSIQELLQSTARRGDTQKRREELEQAMDILRPVQRTYNTHFYEHSALPRFLDAAFPHDVYTYMTQTFNHNHRPISRADGNISREPDLIRAMPWSRCFMMLGIHAEAVGISKLSKRTGTHALQEIYKENSVFRKIIRDYAYSLARNDFPHAWRMIGMERPPGEERIMLAQAFEEGRDNTPRAMMAWLDEDCRKGKELVYRIVNDKEPPGPGEVSLSNMLEPWPTLQFEATRRQGLIARFYPLIEHYHANRSHLQDLPQEPLRLLLELGLDGLNTDISKRLQTKECDEYLSQKRCRERESYGLAAQ